jgi:hypothetical protein
MYCFFVGKKYVSCYASAPKYSAVLAHNSVDLFFLSQLQLNNTEKWTHLRSCLVKSDDCNNLSKRYKVTSDLAIGIFRRLIYYCSCSICYYFCYGDLISTTQLLADSETIQACRTYSHGVRLLPPTSRVCT